MSKEHVHLEIDEKTWGAAREFAERRNTSIEQLVEEFLTHVAHGSSVGHRGPFTPLVEELIGSLPQDVSRDRRPALLERYGLQEPGDQA